MNEVEIQFTKKKRFNHLFYKSTLFRKDVLSLRKAIKNRLLKHSDKIGSKKKYSIHPVINYFFAAVGVLKLCNIILSNNMSV